MPELPEVEIVKQSLIKTTKNKRITDVIVRNRNLRFKLDNNFENFIKNRLVTDIYRIAKYLVLEIDYIKCILVHFGMSGTLHLVNDKNKLKTNLSFYHSQKLPEKHNHIEINFKEFKIIYNDPRRFGFIKIFKNTELLKIYLNSYGLEPLDQNFNLNYLKNKLKNRNKNVKNILLDQKLISGVGNIYANEILFYSKINPKTSGKYLNNKELKKILINSKIVLKKAIKFGGSSIKNFKNTDGSNGTYQKEFKVYDKLNSKCPNKNCKSLIKKIVISNRSTFYCQKCQK